MIRRAVTSVWVVPAALLIRAWWWLWPAGDPWETDDD